MTNRRLFLCAGALLLLGLLLTGCETTQSVVDIRQHPSQDVTIVHTVEQGGLNPAGDRFWHCVQEGQELLCEPVCGVEIECPPAPGLIRAEASAAARIGQGPTTHQPAVEEDLDDDVEVHTTTSEDEVDAEDDMLEEDAEDGEQQP